MRTAVLRSVCGSVVAALAWQPAAAQGRFATDAPYVHEPAHTILPVRVGEFQRSEIYRYDAEGKNVSASYNLAGPEGRLLITVYIYPAPPAAPAERAARCGEEFEAVNGAISSQHGNIAPLERGAAPTRQGVARALAHRAVYRFSSPFDDRVQDLRSEVRLYCYVGGDWLVKYRVSAPTAVDTRDAIEAFIRNGPWPGRSST
jgi:hypothetical protein